ncbi:MAG: DegT/DnrJ/EryC1/StrS family aminotransferase [Candidatus Scalindua rubra]|uniref:Aminotransferase n=1 Tax=Candidatus Scalindua brodae TaxID=237368 RepID=A0A0B0EMY5_9BACT|nr:MAG: aminotransferase [Candidatus Scalindua brodae]MBZ0110724.1 DegT/DnrJ/EryC1/StrS family aminotransferase [Candidatus Scalindua rubra]
MLRKIPTTAVPLSIFEILKGFKSYFGNNPYIEEFEQNFAKYMGSSHAFSFNKCTTSIYIFLKALKKLSNKQEVVIPAYTVPTLVLPIRKAGLIPVLCESSLDTFTMDLECLPDVVNENTLCVLPIYHFGFPYKIDLLLNIAKENGFFVLEDTAQAPGAILDGKKVGTLGDAGCFSLCRGKNFSTFNGGMLVTNSDKLAKIIKEEKDLLPEQDPSFKIKIPFILTALSLVTRPVIYGPFYRMIAPFKHTTVHASFEPKQYSDFQAIIGLGLLNRLDEFNEIRLKKGMALYNALKDNEHLILPEITENSTPVFNHLPVVFKEIKTMERVQAELWDRGIDTGRMYLKPVHHLYDLGYDMQEELFPNALYIAERLLTLPSHPYLDDNSIEKIINVFKLI